MAINQTYMKFFEYYSDIKRTDELKELCESKFLNRELITDLINFTAHKNQEYTLYFIDRNLPVFEGDLSFAEQLEFIHNYGFDPKYLNVLSKEIGINEYLELDYLREKNFDSSILQSLYIANPTDYQKFLKKVLEESTIVDEDQAEIKNIKKNFLEKKKDITEKKKIEKLLTEEKIEISKVLSKANCERIKNILQSFKLPDLEKYSYTDKVIPNEFYQLGKSQTYEGHYKFLGRYLYQIDSKYKKIKLIDLQTNQKHDYKLESSEKTETELIIKNKSHYNSISDSGIKEFPIKTRKINSAFGYLCFIGFVVVAVSYKIDPNLGMILFLVSFVLLLVNFFDMFDCSYETYESILEKSKLSESSLKNGSKILLSKIKNLISKGEFCFIHQYNISKVYKTDLIKPNDCKLSSLKNRTLTIDKKYDIENIKKEADTQLANTSDADQIVKINVQTKEKIDNLIDFSYVLGMLKSVTADELKDNTNRETFDRVIKYCFTLNIENLNNFILDTCNNKSIRLSNENILDLISQNQCDKELLNQNMTCSETIDAVEFILKNVKMMQLHKVFILNTLSSFSKMSKTEQTLIRLCSMRGANMMNLIKTTQGDYDAFLLNKVEDLINQFGSTSSTIEISENGNPSSTDIEIKG